MAGTGLRMRRREPAPGSIQIDPAADAEAETAARRWAAGVLAKANDRPRVLSKVHEEMVDRILISGVYGVTKPLSIGQQHAYNFGRQAIETLLALQGRAFLEHPTQLVAPEFADGEGNPVPALHEALRQLRGAQEMLGLPLGWGTTKAVRNFFATTTSLRTDPREAHEEFVRQMFAPSQAGLPQSLSPAQRRAFDDGREAVSGLLCVQGRETVGIPPVLVRPEFFMAPGRPRHDLRSFIRRIRAAQQTLGVPVGHAMDESLRDVVQSEPGRRPSIVDILAIESPRFVRPFTSPDTGRVVHHGEPLLSPYMRMRRDFMLRNSEMLTQMFGHFGEPDTWNFRQRETVGRVVDVLAATYGVDEPLDEMAQLEIVRNPVVQSSLVELAGSSQVLDEYGIAGIALV